MPYFAIQVKSKTEQKLIAHARGRRESVGERLYFLRRSLRIKRGGQWREETAPIFTGYVFLKADEADPETSLFLRSLPGFIRFLPAHDRISALGARRWFATSCPLARC